MNPIPADGDHFGWSLAAVGPNFLVGAPLYDESNALDTGIAYFISSTSGAVLRLLHNPTPAAGDAFGWSVAAVGTKLAIGAPLDDTAGADAGAVYLFDIATGALTRTLLNPAPGTNDHFGWSMASIGTSLVVGTPSDDSGRGGGGAAYVFDSETGALRQIFLNPNPAAGDDFGWALAALGSNVVIGAPRHDTPATEVDPAFADTGAVYLFDSTNAALLRTFLDPTPASDDLFGRSVTALDSATVLIGSPHEDLGAPNAGAAYVFDGVTGALLQTIANPTSHPDDEFGDAVAAVSAGKAVVSAHHDDTAGLNTGTAYLFDVASGAPLQRFQKSAPVANDEFGRALAVVDGKILVGVPFDDVRGVDAGAAYFFTDVSCGNGVLNPGEQCDDGNLLDGDGCDSNCTPSGCGNGIVTAGEQCDDGNQTSGDGCSATCQNEGVCGNGLLQPPEQCDDGNLLDGDGCDSNCTPSGCGNGIVTAGEQCDAGQANGTNLCCSTMCQRIDSDGDGVCDQQDVCPTVPDPQQSNGDQDVFGDACDLCPEDTDNDSDNDGFCTGAAFNPPAIGGGDLCSRGAGAGDWIKPTVLFGNLDLPAGRNKMRIKGLLTIGSNVPTVAPQTYGIQVRVTDRLGRIIVDEHIAGGLYSQTLLRGWKATGIPPTTWKYLDKNAPPVHNGIKKVLINNRSLQSPGLTRVIIGGETGGTYSIVPGQEPLTVSVELNDTAIPPGGTRGHDQCGEQRFRIPPAIPSCRFVGTNKLSCR